ncbi:hypothetical protein BJQ96_03687 [Flavobacterium sp. PL0002]|nr:hypothetical protein [Flavobacterium sp. PL002]
MYKPTIKNILLCIFTKYIAFYVFLMFKRNDFSMLEANDIGNKLLYFLLMMLPLSIVSMLLFLWPIIYSFKMKNLICFIFIINLVLLIEYLVYTYLASQSNLWNGIYLTIISLLFLGLFFYKHIILMFK